MVTPPVDGPLAALERAWRESGADEDGARWLRERIRQGGLDHSRARHAADLGFGPARLLLGLDPVGPPRPLEEVVEEVDRVIVRMWAVSCVGEVVDLVGDPRARTIHAGMRSYALGDEDCSSRLAGALQLRSELQAEPAQPAPDDAATDGPAARAARNARRAVLALTEVRPSHERRASLDASASARLALRDRTEERVGERAWDDLLAGVADQVPAEALEERLRPLAANIAVRQMLGDRMRDAQTAWLVHLLVEVPPVGPEWSWNHAVCLRQSARPDDALELIDQIRTQVPGASLVEAGRGECLTALYRHEDAIAAYDLAIAALEAEEHGRATPAHWRLPSPSMPWFNRACENAMLGRRDAALADLRRAIEIEPGTAAAAAADDYFEELHDDAEFRSLVGLD